MFHKLGEACLGAWTFLASAHSADLCGVNGLPLTPNSIRVLGRFQALKSLQHPRICAYLDAIRSRHERLLIVSEHYKTSLASEFKGREWSLEEIARLIFQCLDALAYLHQNKIVHRCLSPSCLLIDCQGDLKVSHFGLYHMTEYGACVPFPIGDPKYLPPEVLLGDLLYKLDSNTSSFPPFGPKVDVWSLGIIFLELVLKIELWKNETVEHVVQQVLSLKKLVSGMEVMEYIVSSHNAIESFQKLDSNLKSFLACCLDVKVSNRATCTTLLEHSFLSEQGFDMTGRAKVFPPAFPSMELKCNFFQVDKTPWHLNSPLSSCPMEMVYCMWQLAGGDVETELKRQGMIKTKPAACFLPNLVLEGGEEYSAKKDQDCLMDDTVVILPMDTLKHRLKDVDLKVYCPLLEFSCEDPKSASFQETAKLPIVIREKDVEYQLSRMTLYSRLLLAYPHKRPRILEEAHKDISPLYRARIWAALLNVQGDVQAQYEAIDKETPTPTDRQIEVDIPRCHQYNELLASPTGHIKFKRLLKAWVVSHSQYVYWQGLDSLCAPFLYLNFNDEAVAYACLKAFIPKYLHNFFLKDNSAVIQEYLAVFSHLIAYHDPELTNHLESIGFIPELYAIPWFLTMYTHVFPLHKIFLLWDTLLLGSPAVPLCMGVAILQQLRTNLLSFGFNECILLFSDMPEIDMQRCVQDCIDIFCSTPKSATYRQHGRPRDKSPDPSPLVLHGVPLAELKSVLCPYISGQDLLELSSFGQQHKTGHIKTVYPSNVKLLVVDVRPSEDPSTVRHTSWMLAATANITNGVCVTGQPTFRFSRGAIPDSVNVPYQATFCLDNTPGGAAVLAHKGKMITVLGSSRNNHAVKFGNQLVNNCYPRVTVLYGGIDIFKSTRILVVPSEI